MVLCLVVCFGCKEQKSPKIINEKRFDVAKIKNDEAEIIKEIFYHSRLLGYQIWHPHKGADKNRALSYLPEPIIISKNNYVPENERKTIKKVLSKRLWDVVTENDENKILKEIFSERKKEFPNDLKPLKYKFETDDINKEYSSKRVFNVQFSNIGFSKDRSTAVVVVSVSIFGTGGDLKIILLKKEYKNWRIMHFEQLAVY